MLAGTGFYIVYKFRHKWINSGRDKTSKVNTDNAIAWSLLEKGKYMILSRLLLIALLSVDRVVIEAVSGTESVGYYAAAMKMVAAWLFLGNSVGLSFIAPLTEAVGDKVKFRKLSNSMFGMLVWISVPLALVFSIWPDELVTLVFGMGYESAATAFLVLVWALPFLMLHEGVKVWLLARNRTTDYLIMLFSTLLLLTGLMLVLTGYYGLFGSALAFVLSWVTALHIILLGISKQSREVVFYIIGAYIYPFRWLYRRF
jgi:O-antigen/teichoic acid export membrane protein